MTGVTEGLVVVGNLVSGAGDMVGIMVDEDSLITGTCVVGPDVNFLVVGLSVTLNKALTGIVGTLDGIRVLGNNVGDPVVGIRADGSSEEIPVGDGEGVGVLVENSGLASVLLTSKYRQSPKYNEFE